MSLCSGTRFNRETCLIYKLITMKIIFTFTFLSFLLVNAYSQMPPAGNGVKNPYYSRMATEKLDVSNATWKKILPADLYAVAREGATERAFTGKYWSGNPKGSYFVPSAATCFSDRTLNFQVPVDGPAFSSWSGKAVQYIRMTIHMACNAQRYAADDVAHTWDIFSMTALLRPVSDIV